MFELMEVLALVSGLAFAFLEAVLAVVCLFYSRLSTWLLLAMLGLLGSAFCTVWNIIGSRFLLKKDFDPEFIQVFDMALVFLSLFAYAVAVLGFVIAFADASKKMRRLREATGDARERRPPVEPRGPVPPRQGGNPDIQR